MTMTPAVFTVAEVAQRLRLGRNSVYEAIRRGVIPALRVGRRIVIPAIAFDRFLEGAACVDDYRATHFDRKDDLSSAPLKGIRALGG
jgi:excisionase family DNA binding protein